MRNPADNKGIESSKKRFILIDNYEIINDFPPPFKKVKEGEKEIIEFFNKIPLNKVMKIKFPDEALWTSYSTALKYYAHKYKGDLQFHKRKAEGYLLLIKKVREDEDEKIQVEGV